MRVCTIIQFLTPPSSDTSHIMLALSIFQITTTLGSSPRGRYSPLGPEPTRSLPSTMSQKNSMFRCWKT